jgi:hypothetical protein
MRAWHAQIFVEVDICICACTRVSVMHIIHGIYGVYGAYEFILRPVSIAAVRLRLMR